MTRMSEILSVLDVGTWLSEARVMRACGVGRLALRGDIATLVTLGLVELGHAKHTCGPTMRMYRRVAPGVRLLSEAA